MTDKIKENVKSIKDNVIALGRGSNKIERHEKSVNNLIAKHNKLVRELNRVNDRIGKHMEAIEILKKDQNVRTKGYE